MTTSFFRPLVRLRPWLLALVAAGAGCGKSGDVYRGPVFDMRKPSIDWTLEWTPKEFSIAPPPAEKGQPSVSKAKVLELLHRDLRASIEVYFVPRGANEPEKVLAVLQRRMQRKEFRQGEPKPMGVGGRQGTAVIGSWRQKRDAPVQHCYCVTVPVGGSLWCFIGTVEKDNYDAAVAEFQAALKSVRFR